MRLPSIAVALASSLFLSSARGGQSVEDRNKLLEVPRKAAVELLKDIVPRLIAAFPEKDRAFARSVAVDVTLDLSPYRTGIEIRKGVPTIVFSAGFLVAQNLASDATAVARRTNRYQALPGYAAEFSYIMRYQWYEGQRGRPSPRTFAEYIRWPAAQARAFRTTEEYHALRKEMMRQLLAWASAHYYSHLIWQRHTTESRRVTDEHVAQEKIDAMAIELAFSAGYSPMPPLVNTVLFSSIDHPDRDRLQADWMCRATAVSQAGLIRAAQERPDPDLKGELSGLDTIRAAYSCARSPLRKGAKQPPGPTVSEAHEMTL